MKEILKKKDAMKNVNNQKPTHILRGGIIHFKFTFDNICCGFGIGKWCHSCGLTRNIEGQT